MPVSRRACDFCRAHKLRCQAVDEHPSCEQCKKRNKPCVMPTLPSDAMPTTGPRDANSSLSIPISNHSTVAASSSRHADRRNVRLQESIDDLKRLLSATIDNIRLPPPPPPSTAAKRKYGRIANLNERRDYGISRPRFTAEDLVSLEMDTRNFAPPSSYIQSKHWEARQAESPDPRQQTSQSSIMTLKDCASGRSYLPHPNEGSSLLNEYLHDFNSRIPLFAPEAIYNHVRDCYSGAADKTPLSWILTYVALAIGHRLRAMSLFAAADDASNAEWYLNKCLNVLPDLLLREPTLQLIQVLLGVSVLLQTSTRSRKAALFVSTAMRMAQDLGYNEASQDRDGRPSEDNQEAHVFWIAFFMDTAMNLCATRPNTQKLVDINLPLPSPSSSGSLVLSISDDCSIDREINIFTLHASLALIQAEALEELFSVKGRQRSASLATNTFKSILAELDVWRGTNPLVGSEATSILNSMYRSDVVHSINLEASYFGILYQLHAANALGGFTRRLDVFSADALMSAAGSICFDIHEDAQRLLDIAALTSQANVSVNWITIHALLAALCTAMTYHILGNRVPDAILGTPDLDAKMLTYTEILGVLELAASQAKDTDLASKIDVCRHLHGLVKEGNRLDQT
ncbi:hypothetical protein K505DRAFT_359372 [Melanomma pulvis-pyrius CBS 109.77]|uniref:Zn(2)-C6 fungal-type domain-containing protein n=1 Tax=Melanomma pulvis-pyrius CBS 109.77 TaxID=1314802 RepID=A0A6A6XJT2_9PLEO|nr:hypothetical protein K505DRAFT_359372 [Melanomma pulvis-pyrius CBS 109.77]